MWNYSHILKNTYCVVPFILECIFTIEKQISGCLELGSRERITWKEVFLYINFGVVTWVYRFVIIVQSCPTLCNPMDCSTPGFPVLHHISELAQNSCPSSWWCHPTISSSVSPFSSCPQSFPASRSFPMSWLFALVTKVLELQLQHQSFQWVFRVDFLWDWWVWSPCSPRDSQESFPSPQFESINSLVLSLLYGPTFTSIHDYWKNHSSDYVGLFQQSNVSAF